MELLTIGGIALLVLFLIVIWQLFRRTNEEEYRELPPVRIPPKVDISPRPTTPPPVNELPQVIIPEPEVITPPEVTAPSEQVVEPEILTLDEVPEPKIPEPEIIVPEEITPMRQVVILREELEPKDVLVAREIQESRKPNGIFVVMKTELIEQVSNLAKIRHMSRSALCRELIVRGLASLHADLSAK